jgi:hypothetical protein
VVALLQSKPIDADAKNVVFADDHAIRNTTAMLNHMHVDAIRLTDADALDAD